MESFQVIRSHTARETREFRDKVLIDATDLAQTFFQILPQVQTVLMNVGQYWCDEAGDAVHEDFCLSFDVEGAEDMMAKIISLGEHFYGGFIDEAAAREVLGFKNNRHEKYMDTLDFVVDNGYLLDWVDNLSAIPNFAAFCTEGGNQEALYHENYNPYAIFHRDGVGVKSKVIGKMHRPWLDGVQCSYDGYDIENNKISIEQRIEAKLTERSKALGVNIKIVKTANDMRIYIQAFHAMTIFINQYTENSIQNHCVVGEQHFIAVSHDENTPVEAAEALELAVDKFRV